ncbi:MAG: M28 family metallopeptidase [Candidatus Tenebribacter davisii]|nr:M28 family metallopeptidase [Candidatus Tenebribacter davisii]
MINPYKVIKEIGYERIAGSENEKKAAKTISKYIRELGFKSKLEPFEITSFDTGTAKIFVDGKEYFAHPYGLNENAVIEGELVFLDNPDIIIYNKGAFKDKIIMSYGFSRKLTPKLIEGKVKAYIGIGKPNRKANSSSHRQKTYEEGYVHSVNITHEAAIKLMKQSGKNIKIEIKQKVEKRIAHNIIVDIPGKSFDENLTLIFGHYDSVSRSPGASDNGGGSVTLLKVAEYFSKHSPLRDLRIIFFSGEELGLLGSQAYVKQHLEELKERVNFVVNIDVAGDDIGTDHLNVIGSKELLGYLDGITKEIGMAFNSKLEIFSSDCMPFTPYEIPSVNIFRAGGKGSGGIHTPDDHPKYISNNGLDNTIKATINIVNRVINAKVYPVKKDIDKSLKEKIETYLYNLNYEKPELEWEPKYKK